MVNEYNCNLAHNEWEHNKWIKLTSPQSHQELIKRLSAPHTTEQGICFDCLVNTRFIREYGSDTNDFFVSESCDLIFGSFRQRIEENRLYQACLSKKGMELSTLLKVEEKVRYTCCEFINRMITTWEKETNLNKYPWIPISVRFEAMDLLFSSFLGNGNDKSIYPICGNCKEKLSKKKEESKDNMAGRYNITDLVSCGGAWIKLTSSTSQSELIKQIGSQQSLPPHVEKDKNGELLICCGCLLGGVNYFFSVSEDCHFICGCFNMSVEKDIKHWFHLSREGLQLIALSTGFCPYSDLKNHVEEVFIK